MWVKKWRLGFQRLVRDAQKYIQKASAFLRASSAQELHHLWMQEDDTKRSTGPVRFREKRGLGVLGAVG